MLLLASASPARRRLLEQAAIPHRVRVSGVDEEAIHDPEPRRLVQLLARAKAETLALGDEASTTGHCLIGADGSRLLETVTTRVQFAVVDDATIAAYVASGEPLACAGGFALEGRGGLLVERIEGCYSNVIGLSLPLLRRWLDALPA